MIEKISVLHVSQPTEAGVAAVAMQLIVDQVGRGWRVDLACPPEGPLADRARAAGAHVHPWPAGRSPGIATLAETRRLGRLVDALDPDVVHLHSSKAGLAGRLALRGRRPTVFQPHMWSFLAVRGPIGRASLWWERLAARWTHRLICVSDDELRIGREAGIAGPATVVPNGVDTGHFRPAEAVRARAHLGIDDRPTAVCVGRLAQQKGQDLLLSAWPAVLGRVPDAHLVLVGDGPMREAWRQHPVADDPSVTWTGHSGAPIHGYLAADVVVLPSRSEGMALVPLEAMACGRPVVAFDVSGVRESVGDAGAIVAAGDLDAMADAVADRLCDRALAEEEGRRGRERVEHLFDERRTTARLAEIATELSGPASA